MRRHPFPGLLLSLVLLTRSLAQTGDSTNLAVRTKSLAALAQLDRTLEATPNDLKARLVRGQIYLVLGIRGEALSDFGAVLELDAENVAANDGLRQVEGMSLRSFEEIDTLLSESVAALIAGQSQHATDSFLLANLYGRNLGDVNVGRAYFFARRGDLFAAAKQIDLARDDYRHAMDYNDELSPDAHIGLARLLAIEKKFPEAIAEIDLIKTDDEEERARATTARQEVLALIPLADRTQFLETLEAMLGRARALGDKGNRKEALDLYDFILLRNPRLIDAYEGRARFPRKSSDAARDRAVVKELRAPEPVLPAATAAGFVLAQANVAVHRRPFSSRPYIERSRLLSKSGKSPESRQSAIADARFAIELEPFDPQTHVALCEALLAARGDINAFEIVEREQQAVQALQAADRALALAPNDFELLVWRGRMESEHGVRLGQNQRDAARFFTRALAQDPTSISTLLLRATTAEENENNEEAAADYRAVLALDPNDIPANYRLGWSYLRLGRARDAVGNFKATQKNALLAQDSVGARIAAQMHAVALAIAEDDSCDATAQAALEGGDWENDASVALAHYSQKKPTPQLGRLKKMQGKPAP
jgi:tetratricopeptide (TPR) repeat protein